MNKDYVEITQQEKCALSLMLISENDFECPLPSDGFGFGFRAAYFYLHSPMKTWQPKLLHSLTYNIVDVGKGFSYFIR